MKKLDYTFARMVVRKHGFTMLEKLAPTIAAQYCEYLDIRAQQDTLAERSFFINAYNARIKAGKTCKSSKKDIILSFPL